MEELFLLLDERLSRTEVDPNATGFENFPQPFDVFDDVVRRIDEETRGNAIPIIYGKRNE